MSLLNYLLSGSSPESECFINSYVPQFEFINTKGKYYKFYNLGIDGLIMFYPNSTKTKKFNPIYNISNNELPTKIKKSFSINVKNNIKIIWNINIYVGYSVNPISTETLFQVNKQSLTNLEVLEYIYKSYFETIHKYVFKHKNNKFFTKFYYNMDSIKVINIDDCTYIYPNFSNEYFN